MDKDTVTLRIRERLDARMLPRVIPSLMREPGRPTSPRGNIYKDSSIGVAKCAACDDPGAQIAYQFRTAESSGSTADATESGRKSVNGVSRGQTRWKCRMTLRDNKPDLSGGTVLAASLRHDEGRMRVVREKRASRGPG